VIDFRYHLVSIVAVFLALAIGIVVGATALKPKVEDLLNRASQNELRKIDTQRATISSQQNQIYSDQQFAQVSAPLVLANLLTGEKVVLVTAPGASGPAISGITTALGLAGAKVTGQAELQPAFFDTSASTESSLDALAQTVAPPTVTPGDQTVANNLSAQVAGQQEAAEVIAPALVTLAGTMVWLGEFDQAERWLRRTAQALQTDTGPDITLLLHHTVGILHACRGRRDTETRTGGRPKPQGA